MFVISQIVWPALSLKGDNCFLGAAEEKQKKTLPKGRPPMYNGTMQHAGGPAKN